MRYRSLLACVLGLCFSVMALCAPAMAAERKTLTYDQIRNTGLAAVCPTVPDEARGRIEVPVGGMVKLKQICFQPVSLEVEEEKRNGEKEFFPAKPILLSAATLGPLKANVIAEDEATLEFDVVDGITSQPTTGQMPRRELVPLLFSVKQMKAIAKGENAITPSTDFEGDFLVPGYRNSSFLDPRGRGTATGYESAVGLQAVQDEFKASQKTDELTKGQMSLRIARVDGLTGEMAGSFVSLQLSSDEQGTMERRPVRIQGLFYGQVDRA